MGSRFVRMIACGLLLFILPGCWDRTELTDLMLVTGVGIDKSGKDLRLCTQTFVPQISAGGGIQDRLRSCNVKQGQLLPMPCPSCSLSFQEDFFFGHSMVLVISKQFAQSHGVQELSDFMVRFPEVWYRKKLFISKVPAESILLYQSPISMSAEALRELSEARHMLEMDLLHYATMVKSEARTAVLPIVDLKQAGHTSSNKVIQTVGTAVFNKDNWAGELDMELTRGLLWFRNEIREATFTIKPVKGKEEVSLMILRAEVQLKPRIEGDKWKMTVKVVSEDDIVQNETSLDTSDPKVIDRLERLK